MKRGMQWPIGIAVILALTVISNVWLAVIASRDEAFAVEPDYYQKAVRFDDEMALRAESARLGWRVVPRLRLGTPASAGSLTATVTDSSGAPVQGAQVEVLAMHNARASRQLTATLAEAGNGAYSAPLDAQRPGEWELRFTITRGSERFAVRERVDAAVPPSE
jgi:nitrogen fixation protein FixH